MTSQPGLEAGMVGMGLGWGHVLGMGSGRAGWGEDDGERVGVMAKG